MRVMGVLLLGLVLFDGSWEPADDTGDGVAQAEPGAPQGGLVADRVA